MGEARPFSTPAQLRFDAEDNIGSSTPQQRRRQVQQQGSIVQALGRGWSRGVYDARIERAIPAPASFYQPTDTSWDPTADVHHDGYATRAS